MEENGLRIPNRGKSSLINSPTNISKARLVPAEYRKASNLVIFLTFSEFSITNPGRNER